jgi:hypothetical protein
MSKRAEKFNNFFQPEMRPDYFSVNKKQENKRLVVEETLSQAAIKENHEELIASDGAKEQTARLNIENEIELVEDSINDPEVLAINEALKHKIEEKEHHSPLNTIRKFAAKKQIQFALATLSLLSTGLKARGDSRTDADVYAEGIRLEKTAAISDNEKKSERSEQQEKIKHENYKLEATSYFKTDQADISPENEKKLADYLDKFLNTITPENYQEEIKKAWIIRGSNDERETHKWEGKNENLTNARIDAMAKVMYGTLKNHNFGKLTEKQAETLRNKEISRSYPKGRADKENGVTYLTDKINPDTNSQYSEEEITAMKKNDPAKYHELMESCRYTNFEVETTFFNLSQYDRINFLIDESGSMNASKAFISDQLRKIEFNKPIDLFLYSDQFDPKSEINCHNNFEAADKILSQSKDGSFRERQIDAALGLVTRLAEAAEEKQKKDGQLEKQKIYIATDEALQGLNSTTLEVLYAKAKQANIEIEFVLSYSKNNNKIGATQESGLIKISLDDLIQDVDNLKDQVRTQRAKHGYYFTSERDAKGNLIPHNYNELGPGADELPDQKLDEFYEDDLKKTENVFTVILKNHPALRGFLSRKGYGKTNAEITANIENDLSGPGGYAKLGEMINIENIKNDIKLKYSGHGNSDSGLAEDLMHWGGALHQLIEARNLRDLMLAALKNLPADQIPNIKDNIRINLANFETNQNFYWDGQVQDKKTSVSLPINGPGGWVAELYY